MHILLSSLLQRDEENESYLNHYDDDMSYYEGLSKAEKSLTEPPRWSNQMTIDWKPLYD